MLHIIVGEDCLFLIYFVSDSHSQAPHGEQSM